MAADRSRMTSTYLKRALPIVVSVAVLALLWWRIDTRAIWGALKTADPWWTLAGIVALAPLCWATAVRFQWLSHAEIKAGLANRLILAACTLNLFLPSKMGDLAKAWVLERRHGFDRKFAFSLVIFEKLFDLGSLLVWGVFALAWLHRTDALFLGAAVLLTGALLAVGFVVTPLCGVIPVPARLRPFAQSWLDLVRWFWSDARRAFETLALSLAIWIGHLLQLWLFARALGSVPLAGSMAASTLAILAGLLPFTMGGIGIRDLAIVYFYHQWLSLPQCAALGLLATLRYLLPAVAGLPFVSDYWRAPEPRE
jgi:uncharacterized membrane protein YbhN (UPF0104 family)